MVTWPATCYKLNKGKATYANGQPVQPGARSQDAQTAALAKFLWKSRKVAGTPPEHRVFKDRTGASESLLCLEANGPAAGWGSDKFQLGLTEDQGLCCL